MLELRDISKGFGGRPVIDHLSLTLPFEGIAFLMGPSGAGKSVLGQLCALLLEPDSGERWLDGVRVDGLSAAKRRPLHRRVAYLAQGPSLLGSMSVLENVALGPVKVRGTTRHEGEQLAREALGALGLSAIERAMPQQLSPGEVKRAAIARAMACAPALLIHDEPTTGLDPEAARAVDAALQASAHRTAALVVSHDLTSAQAIAGRTLLLHEGRIGYDGPFLPLLARPHAAALALLGPERHG